MKIAVQGVFLLILFVVQDMCAMQYSPYAVYDVALSAGQDMPSRAISGRGRAVKKWYWHDQRIAEKARRAASMQRNALHIAAINGDISSIPGLLRFGLNPKARDVRGYTPLHYAAELTDARIAQEVIDVLIGARASVLEENEGGKRPQECASNALVRKYLAVCVDRELSEKCAAQQDPISIVAPKARRIVIIDVEPEGGNE